MKKLYMFLIVAFCSISLFAQTEQYSLKNGIPVYYKEVDSTRMCSVIIVIKGGNAMHPREYSGLESSLLELMCRGTENYPYEKIQELKYQKHIGYSHGTSYAGSTFSLSCIDYYFDEALKVFLDCFLNPSYDETQFQNMLTDYSQKIQRTLNNPEAFLSYSLTKEIYKNHPLGTSSAVLPESIENITLANVKDAYKKLIDSNRLAVVAAGNMNMKKLLAQLNKTLGKIVPLSENFTQPNIPPLNIAGENIVLQNAAIAGSGHIARVFESPSILSVDYMAARIAAQMYNEVLFNVVRTMRGACYTPSTSIGFSAAPFGVDFLSRVSDLQNATRYLKEAQEIFAGGKMVSSFDGELEYDSIEERLPDFINKYITSAYDNQKTCSSIAGRVASGLLYMNDIDGLDKNMERAKAVTAEDIKRVFKKYWVDSSARFFAIVGPGDVDKVYLGE